MNTVYNRYYDEMNSNSAITVIMDIITATQTGKNSNLTDIIQAIKQGI
jgi:hypothetical protein